MPRIGNYDSDAIHPDDKVLGTEGDPYGDLGSTKNHKVDTLYLYMKQRLGDEGFPGGVNGPNTVVQYRSSHEDDGYIYEGYLYNTVPQINRILDNIIETAQGVTDLETDWANRLTLTYI